MQLVAPLEVLQVHLWKELMGKIKIAGHDVVARVEKVEEMVECRWNGESPPPWWCISMLGDDGSSSSVEAEVLLVADASQLRCTELRFWCKR